MLVLPDCWPGMSAVPSCPIKGQAWTRFRTVFLQLSVLSHLSMTVFAAPQDARKMLQSKGDGNQMEEVFTDGEEANMFLGRSLLFNRFDFEMFVPGNPERECYEEVCSYEEAREIFKDHDKTIKFWKEYSTKGPFAKPESHQKIDVTGLLTGLVAAGALLVIIWFIGYYIHKYKCTPRRPQSGTHVDHVRPSFRASISRSLERMFSREPVPPSPLALELPSYEQAVALNRPQDVPPPPPYPGTVEEMRLYRKSISLPAPLSH